MVIKYVKSQRTLGAPPVVLILFSSLLFGGLACVTSAPVLALQPEHLYAMRTVNLADLSADGRYLLYNLVAYDREAGSRQVTLIRRDLDTGQEIILLHPEDRGRGAVWRPDGQAIAFVKQEADGAHVWVMAADGGEQHRLSRVSDRYSNLRWAPDGRTIAYLAHALVNTESAIADETRDSLSNVGTALKPELGLERVPDDVLVAEHIGYRHLNSGYREGTLKQLYLLDVKTGDLARLVDAPLDIKQIEWSPDGAALVCEAKRRQDLGINLNSDLWLVSRQGGELQQLTWNAGPDVRPEWSADGTIIYLRHADPLCESAPRRIAIMHDPDQGDRGRITESGADFDNLIWKQFAGGAYFTAFVRGCIDLYRTVDMTPLTPGGWDFWDVKIGGGRAVLAGTNHLVPSTICVLPLAGDALQISNRSPISDRSQRTRAGDPATTNLRVIVDPNREWAESAALVQPESFQIEVEGRTIHGWYFLPAGLAPGERVPTVLSIHGGPEWMYGGYFLPEFHILPAHGYAVLIANPTGSTGYGFEFQRAIRGDWVGAPARELLACVDWAIADGWADPEHLAVMGGSYGGHLGAALTTQTDRFRAAAIDRMTCDLVAMWGTTDEKWFPEWEFHGKPWEPEARDYYYRNSPTNFAHNARTATLLSHGMKDYRCLIGQAETWFSILKANGVPVRFLRFGNEGHGIRDTRNIVFYQQELLGWFDRYVKGELP
jgi:dipeptidyl aminopeptidase/acylaminoacyl peptidase